jgi:hypothetical protein
VEGAAQAAVLQPAEGEVGAAMRAVALDQAVAALLVAKQHQIFAEQFDRLDRARPLQLVDQRRRLPVHPHQFPARVLGPVRVIRSFCSWLIMAAGHPCSPDAAQREAVRSSSMRVPVA